MSFEVGEIIFVDFLKYKNNELHFFKKIKMVGTTMQSILVTQLKNTINGKQL